MKKEVDGPYDISNLSLQYKYGTYIRYIRRYTEHTNLLIILICIVNGMYCIFYSYVQKNILKNLHSLKLDVLEEGGREEGVSSELAELGRRADQLAHQLRNLRYRLD